MGGIAGNLRNGNIRTLPLIMAVYLRDRDIKAVSQSVLNALDDASLIEELKRDSRLSGIDMMQVSAKVECEIAGMGSQQEREEFLRELGIKEPAINILARLCIKALNLISFFTVGPNEVHQWTIRRGSSAPEAAGAIHTDMQKGFIRAEVIKYADLASLGSEAKVKESGKLYIKGKDYIVEDGDIIYVRFNV